MASTRSTDDSLIDALPESLRELARRAAISDFRRGQLLIEEGQRGDTLYIVLAGRVRAFSRSESGRELTHGSYGPGEYVGEMSLDGGARSASVEALEPTRCGMVTRYTLTRHIAQHPEFAFELLAKVIRRARAATLSAKQLALNDVYGRLKGLLESLATREADGSGLIVERLTHQEIANRLGCSREMVSRLMKDLDAGGYLHSRIDGLVLTGSLPSRW